MQGKFVAVSCCLCYAMLLGRVSYGFQKEFPKAFALSDDQAKAADKDFKTIRPLSSKARQTRHLDDGDLSTLREILLRRGQTVPIKIEALKPLSYLRPNTLKPGQEAMIADFIKEILVIEDVKNDPDGFVKSYALTAVNSALRTRSLLPCIKMLKSDKRATISSFAARIEKKLLGPEGH